MDRFFNGPIENRPWHASEAFLASLIMSKIRKKFYKIHQDVFARHFTSFLLAEYSAQFQRIWHRLRWLHPPLEKNLTPFYGPFF